MAEQPVPYDQPRTIRELGLLTVQAALNLIPHVGGFLATYFGEIRSRRIEERMKRYFWYFGRRLEEMDQSKIDFAYLHSEEFAELFVKGAEQAARSATEEKIKRFANILANNAALNPEYRDRTESVMSFVDRLTDLDAFVLVCFGNPQEPTFRAESKHALMDLVNQASIYLGHSSISELAIVESAIYLDNLGLAWINEKETQLDTEPGANRVLKEFSTFRTPLGDAVVRVIVPPKFFVPPDQRDRDKPWPEGFVNPSFSEGLNL